MSPLRAAGPLRFASSHRGTGVSPLTGCRPSRNTVRPAVPAEVRGGPFPCPGIAGFMSVMLGMTDARLAIGPARRSLRSVLARPERHPGHRQARRRAAESRVQ